MVQQPEPKLSSSGVADLLGDVFGAAVQNTAAQVITADAKQEGSDDDWGDFDQYEDPHDVQFPTLQSVASSSGQVSVSQKSEDLPSARGAQEFPKVNNLEDLMSLMNATSLPVASVQGGGNEKPLADLLDIG